MSMTDVDELHPRDMVNLRVEISDVQAHPGDDDAGGHYIVTGRTCEAHSGVFHDVTLRLYPDARLWRVHCPAGELHDEPDET